MSCCQKLRLLLYWQIQQIQIRTTTSNPLAIPKKLSGET